MTERILVIFLNGKRVLTEDLLVNFIFSSLFLLLGVCIYGSAHKKKSLCWDSACSNKPVLITSINSRSLDINGFHVLAQLHSMYSKLLSGSFDRKKCDC